ncbi:MAG TPA: peptidylprolyl isomerase [Chitinophagales bacterium]|nr:peptidylprolyl isomerase [Chitinophagales bacterium]HNE46074.1 peptidylprolyl isomerase [Chitinophagales bacterium]HNF68325.1 peptidylprolyl isomerase [Chitinophagales bacterium]HNI53959.1 peptidylprolyl isomerase [Chitinophagales bacterium]HNK96702.1 peptidylprolyl isomerase [Chitinophagales bacterium]
MKKIVIVIAMLLPIAAFAQPVVDKIVAQVGDKIVLMSEVESYYYDALQQGEVPDDYRCAILQELITQKLMLIQAEKDSIVVTDDEVSSNIDNRIRYFIQMFGSEEKMEEFYGKSVQEIKEEFREDVKNMLLIDRMRESIVGGMSVSPTEVKEFYNSIPKDSLPFVNAQIEYSHIVMVPKANAEQKQIAKEKADGILKRIKNGEDFCKLASLYSGDGSKDNCGNLGCATRDTYVTEFSAAAFRLQPGEISDVVETQFGYHIIRMDSRQGDKACLSHILIMPPVTNLNFVAANKKLDSLRAQIMAKNITFCDAAKKYSDDEQSSKSCGVVINPQTGSGTFEISELSPDDYYSIENLKPGEVSQVLPYTTADGKKAVRIIMLNDQTEPHQLNLKDDYAKLQTFTLNIKQNKEMESWIRTKAEREYIRIDNIYSGCSSLNELMLANGK